MAGTMLPAWLPTDALLLALVAFLGAVFVMNKNRSWFMRVVDFRYPLVVGAGVLIAASNQLLAVEAGVGSPDTWVVAGVLIAAFGVAMWYMENSDD